MKQIRVSLPEGLVDRLHPNVKERDKRIQSALEEYLSIPTLGPAVPRGGRRRG
jgi:hypothetical protein